MGRIQRRCFDPVDRDRIRTQFALQYTCPTNPIAKVPLHIIKGVNDKLDIVEQVTPQDGTGPVVQHGGVAAAQPQTVGGTGPVTNEMLMVQLRQMEQRREEMYSQECAERAQFKAWQTEENKKLIEAM